jgi:ribosomal-protein-alanine N-acetyltransferase
VTAVSIGLEAASAQDISTLVELEEILFPDDSPWTAAMFAGELAAGHHYVVHRDAEGAVDGYAGLALLGDEAEVHTIGVRPAAQGAGLGRALLRDLLAHAGRRRVVLEVRTDNAPAIALYESEGFVILGVRRRYYRPSGADAYTMARPGSWTPDGAG